MVTQEHVDGDVGAEEVRQGDHEGLVALVPEVVDALLVLEVFEIA